MLPKKVSMRGTYSDVPIEELIPDPEQPRQDFDEAEMEKLKDSVQDRGIMIPLTVEPKKEGKYLIIDGERRFKCALNLKIDKVPVNILAKSLNEFERNIIRFQLQETHKQWSPFEKAEAMANLKKYLDLSVVDLARALAVAPITCQRYLSLLTFPVGIRKAFIQARIPFSYLEILSYTNAIMPDVLVKRIPNYLDKVVKKYKKGYIKSHKDFVLVNRMIKAGQYKVVEKFFTNEKYTATNAYVDSGMELDRFSEAITSKAKILCKELDIADKNDLTLDEEAIFILAKLRKKLTL